MKNTNLKNFVNDTEVTLFIVLDFQKKMTCHFTYEFYYKQWKK